VGFSGATQGPKLDKKRKLLESEGVKFDDDGKISLDSFLGDLDAVVKRPATGDVRSTSLDLADDREGKTT